MGYSKLAHQMGLRGRIGDLIYKWYGKKLVITRVPRFKKGPGTAAQLRQRSRFRAASRYAQEKLRDPQQRAAYATIGRKRGWTARAVAIQEFLKDPNNAPRIR